LSSPSPPQTFTQTEVALANSASKYLTVIDGKVYNLNEWINKHPGGKQEILNLCGK
jgi:cytochrome b involved in lipid metabolism